MSEFRRRLMMAAGEKELPNYLCFTAKEASTITRAGTYAASLEYSTDGSTWNSFDSNTTISLGANDIVYFRGTNTRLASGTSAYTQFVMTGSIEASGNIMSLLSTSGFDSVLTIPDTYCFYRLFYGCTSLKAAPELPATTMKNYCYDYMFYGCTGLTTPPALPAKNLGSFCYQHMFYNCSNLTTAPELPAETLAQYCYDRMFVGCSSLASAPELLALTLPGNCYRQMFQNCSNINYIKMLATSMQSNSLGNWVQGVAASGTFVKNAAMTTLSSGASGIPNGWTVVDN